MMARLLSEAAPHHIREMGQVFRANDTGSGLYFHDQIAVETSARAPALA